MKLAKLRNLEGSLIFKDERGGETDVSELIMCCVLRKEKKGELTRGEWSFLNCSSYGRAILRAAKSAADGEKAKRKAEGDVQLPCERPPKRSKDSTGSTGNSRGGRHDNTDKTTPVGVATDGSHASSPQEELSMMFDKKDEGVKVKGDGVKLDLTTAFDAEEEEEGEVSFPCLVLSVAFHFLHSTAVD